MSGTLAPSDKQQQQAQGSGSGNYFTGLQDFIQQLSQLGAGYQLTDQDILNLGNFQLLESLQQQAQDSQYKSGYLDYLNNDLGLKANQMAQAQQQMDFQNGPYWDWYTQQYFPAQQKMSDNQLGMSNNQLMQAQEGTKQAQESTKQSQFDTTRASNNAIAQAYNTQAARIGEQATQYQAMQSLGLISPSFYQLNKPQGY